MNIKSAKHLLLIAVTAVVLSACATITAPSADKDGTAHPAAIAAAAVEALTADVRDNWTGTDIPDDHWIAATSLQICKRQGLNIPTFTADPANQALVIDAALEHLCP